jgi:hypothetical protein
MKMKHRELEGGLNILFQPKVTTTTTPITDPNLLINGDFSDGLTNWDTVYGIPEVDTENYHTASPSVKLVDTSIQQFFSVEGEEVVHVSLWCKGVIGDYAYVGTQWVDGYDELEIEITTEDWIFVEHDLAYVHDEMSALYLYTDGTAYIDDVVVHV